MTEGKVTILVVDDEEYIRKLLQRILEDAGYDVRIIGEDIGVENYNPPPNVYGIIANPPCTMFSIARTNAKTPRDLREGMRLVKECLRIIWECQYPLNGDQRTSNLKFWMIENPATGFLKWFLGNPVFQYCHSEYGEPNTKHTALWGMFNLPHKPLLHNPVPTGSCMGNQWARWRNSDFTSKCPINFAKAFYAANP